MKLTTIWTLPSMALRERLARTHDALAMKVAARLPRRVKYWAYIQAGSKAMLPNQLVPEANFMELLERVPR